MEPYYFVRIYLFFVIIQSIDIPILITENRYRFRWCILYLIIWIYYFYIIIENIEEFDILIVILSSKFYESIIDIICIYK